MDISIILIATILVESVVNAVKPIWNKDKRHIEASAVASLVAGLLLAFTAQLNFPRMIDVELSPEWLAFVFTGIIISRGSNFVYDIIKRVNAHKGV